MITPLLSHVNPRAVLRPGDLLAVLDAFSSLFDTRGSDSMNASRRRIRRLVWSLLIAGLLLPLLWYVMGLALVPTLSPAQAIERLQAAPASAVLIDVRPADLFEKQHVFRGGVHPLSEIRGWASFRRDLPSTPGMIGRS